MLRRPLLGDEFVLREQRIAKKTLRIDALGRIMWTGINAAWRGKLRAKIASVGLISGHLFLLDLDR